MLFKLVTTTFIVLNTIGFASYAKDADVVKPTSDFTQAEKYEALPAGALTHKKKLNADAFSHASANMSFERELDFQIGNAFFTRLWVSSPASTKSSDGLGPLLNARACQSCHIKDGRGHPPEPGDTNAVSMLVRLSIPAQSKEQQAMLDSGHSNSIAEPTYGGQFQDVSIAGVHSEGSVTVEYSDKVIQLEDADDVTLRQPKLIFSNLMYSDFHNQIMTSARVAPQMIGLGLLEAISVEDILANEDVDDSNGDGISGKANKVWSIKDQKLMLGRFGLKAGQPSLTQQNQAAFNGDLGLSTPFFPNSNGDCTPKQKDCVAMSNGDDEAGLEVSQQIVDQVLFYTRNLAVPSRRGVNDPDVLKGKALFYQSGCIACHTPKFITPRNTAEPEQSRQLIWPYTDLLLHDMGEGLADNRPEAKATGREWRTPALWGIGLTKEVNGHTQYLHDGRARDLLEAILWHGGEAKASQQKVTKMTALEREQLIKFVKSL